MFNTFAEEAETQRARKESEREGEKERKNKREEREIAEGFGYGKIYEEPARSSPVDSPVCTYDPKILRSFPHGQASRGSRWRWWRAPFVRRDSFLPPSNDPGLPSSYLRPSRCSSLLSRFVHPLSIHWIFSGANGYNLRPLSREMRPHRVKNWLLI